MTDERYERARQHVKALRGFYIHFGIYLLVNAGLVVVNLLTSPGELWFYWPLLGWGIGVAVHAFAVFAHGPFGAEWEERKIRRLMERDATPSAPVEDGGTST